MITQNIKSIGIELEGGINREDLENLEEYCEKNNLLDYVVFGDDGSVVVKSKEIRNIEISFWHYDLDTFLKFVEYVFNKCNFEQNATCGNHMHFKFINNEKALSILSYATIWKKFISEYKKFAKSLGDNLLVEKYLSRLKNKYCLAKYDVNVVIEQLELHEKASCRYRAINLNSYNIHKTIEIRILPHFSNYEEAERSILWLIKTVDKIYSTANCTLSTKSIKLNFSENNNTFNYTINKQNLNEMNIKIKVIKV
jgi:hypothetical protein